jgi:hypothetical protein
MILFSLVVCLSLSLFRSLVDGLIDGAWEEGEDGLHLKYGWDHVNTPELYKLMLKLESEVPLATEFVPSPQSGSLLASYQVYKRKIS